MFRIDGITELKKIYLSPLAAKLLVQVDRLQTAVFFGKQCMREFTRSHE